VYNIIDSGNFEGLNIPNLIGTDFREIAEENRLSEKELHQRLAASIETLRLAREKRVYPHLDDKMLTAWNAMMIAALAKASHAFHEPEMLDAALKAIHFIETRLRKNGRLYARFRDGDVRYAAYLDDYACLLWAYLELYAANPDPSYLDRAEQISTELDARFRDGENGGFFFTAADSEPLLIRQKQGFDDAIPSGNSIAAFCFFRLAKLTGKTEYSQKAEAILSAFQQDIERYPGGFLMMLQALMGLVAGGKEIVVSGTSAKDKACFRKQFYNTFRPFDVYVDANPDHPRPYWQDKLDTAHAFVLYMCEQFTCRKPVYGIEAALKELDNPKTNQ
jgi:uncharacterized protein YyaL (SSP411 family)